MQFYVMFHGLCVFDYSSDSREQHYDNNLLCAFFDAIINFLPCFNEEEIGSLTTETIKYLFMSRSIDKHIVIFILQVQKEEKRPYERFLHVLAKQFIVGYAHLLTTPGINRQLFYSFNEQITKMFFPF